MGQKVNPVGFRTGVIKDWKTKWYAGKKQFSELLIEDYKIREYVKARHFEAGVSSVEIERAAARLKVTVFASKPGMIIGKGGTGIEQLKAEVQALVNNKQVQINIIEIKNADMDAQLVAENIASQLERRISYRRAMKQCMQRTMKSGAKGIKTLCSGRLGGAEIARNERYVEGNVPLQTLRADIDYGFAEANTTYGKIGVKVWINKGQVLPTRAPQTEERGK